MQDTLKKLEAEFDEQFGTDGPDKNCDSIGRSAGCDDCFDSIKLRAEHKSFLLKTASEMYEKGREDLVEDIKKDIGFGKYGFTTEKGDIAILMTNLIQKQDE